MLPDSNLFNTTPNNNPPTNDEIKSESLTKQLTSSNLSPREYFNEKSPKTNAQKIAVFACFLKEVKQQEYFSREDIRSLHDAAKEPLDMRNYSRDFDTTFRNSWIAKGSEGSYFLTHNGEIAVNTGKYEVIHRKQNSKKHGGQKVSSTIRPQITALELNPLTDGYKHYWKINKGDKILWLLAQASNHGLADLNYKEIAALADKLSNVIEPKSISALVAAHIKQGRIFAKTVDGIKVLKISPPGIEFVKISSTGEVA